MSSGVKKTIKGVYTSKLPRWWITFIVTVAIWLFDSVGLTIVGIDEVDDE